MKLFKLLSLCLLTLSVSSFALETIEVEQKNKEFSEKEITIKQGDKVKFTNQDPFFHNVFSLSDAKFFDLGSFPKGEFKEVTFEEAGEVEVECAIHPNMKMTIKVEKK
ncbi:cupredoxin domain-containing protein [Glaciecola petra]|uniref:Plastocyanin/azurin family copper-binding protein n=1 Tax=Glaciecola petra TaxID=3075602 RepID=A0ABU2ZL26_9ALTE|nr:plastocyanin/azurin family copper-binding protein [Aestuariibacter sp. P117]MDT0593325.1 plastocyanin/azurin family copper-binding protein [Aestuariibacter sp. P117]